jgi:hypothetical protein
MLFCNAFQHLFKSFSKNDGKNRYAILCVWQMAFGHDFLTINIMFFDFGVFCTPVSVLLSAFLKTIQAVFILHDGGSKYWQFVIHCIQNR